MLSNCHIELYLPESLYLGITKNGWGKQNCCLLQKPASQASGLDCQASPLMIVQENAFVLLLLLNQDADLFSQVVNRLVEFSVEAIRYACNQC